MITKVTPTNFEMFSGDSKLLTITVKDQNDAVVDISGGAVLFTLSKKAGKPPVESIPGILSDPTNGICTVQLNPAHTDDKRHAWYWECQLTDVSSRISTVAFGSVQIRPDSTP